MPPMGKVKWISSLSLVLPPLPVILSLWVCFVAHFPSNVLSLPPPAPLCSLPFSLKREEDWLKQAEVLYYTLERSNAVPQLKHNPWSLKCHQQHLQRMKENAKHRNQYSILFALPTPVTRR